MLAQVMVAAVVGSVMTLGLASYMTSVQKESALASSKMNALGLASDLRTEVQTPEGCQNTFGAGVALSQNILDDSAAKQTFPQLMLGATPVSANQDLRPYNIRVNELSLTEMQSRGTTVGGAHRIYTGTLMLNASSGLKQANDNTTSLRQFAVTPVGRITFLLNSNRTVHSCFAEESVEGLMTQNCLLQQGQVIGTKPVRCDNSGILREVCESLNGTFDVSRKKCNMGCTSRSVTWSSCVGSLGAMAHGASVTVSNTAPGFSGTVVARCEDGNVVQSSPTCNALFAGAEYSVPGTYSLTVPPGRYRVRVVGGGGGGRLSRWNCAFHMYSGSGGAAVDAIIEFAASTTISIRVGAGGNADEPTHPLCAVGASSGQQSSFGSWIIARGGGVGANIHYRHAWADNPSPGGGTYSVSGPVTIVRAENGQGIGTARGSHNVGHCGGNSGLGVGSGACAAGQRPGIGGGGFGNGTNYTNGSGNTAGGHGFVSVYPER